MHRGMLEALEHHQSNQDVEYVAQVRQSLEERVRKMNEILTSLEGARAVQQHLTMPLTDDALRVVSEMMTDELNVIHSLSHNNNYNNRPYIYIYILF
jgi:hypothetical protein